MKQLPFFLIVFYLLSCSPKKECENVVDVTKVNADSKLVRLEKELFNAKSSKEIGEILKKYPLAAKYILGVDPSDSLPLSDLFQLYTQPSFREFYEQGEKINSDFKALQPSVEDLMKHIKYYFPKYKAPDVYTLMTGLPRIKPGEPTPDVIMPDSAKEVVGIGIDYFYGEKSKYRPDEYQYMLQRRQPYFIVPTLAMKIAQMEFVSYDARDKTMLAEMIKWGKAHYFIERMMPCAPDSIVMGYTSTEMDNAEEGLEIIWGHFIKNELFYKTDLHEIQRYTGESPKVVAIGEKCPGRIGRYLGWQIVKKYMENNPGVTLEQLMNEGDAQKIFRLSKYKPRAK